MFYFNYYDFAALLGMQDLMAGPGMEPMLLQWK